MKLASCFAFILLAACGGGSGSEPSKVPPTASTGPAPTSTAAAAAPTGPVRFTRGEVKGIVQAGLGQVLKNVTLEEQPVFVAGKFHGFRIVALRGQLPRSGLMKGDVVTKLNKLPIEKPDEAFAAFKSLETAKEIRIDYERAGTPAEIVIPIDE